MGQKQSVLAVARWASPDHSKSSTKKLADRPCESFQELQEALVGACLEGKSEFVLSLCGACDINAPALPWGESPPGESEGVMPPLLAALKSGHVETMSAVLQHPGCSVTAFRDPTSKTFLHIVAEEAGKQWAIQPWKRE